MGVTKVTLDRATRYWIRRALGKGSTSTLKKVAKFKRILQGEAHPAPQRFKMVAGKKLVLHATRGWKRA